MKNDFHRQIVKNAPFGYAHHEIILDDAGKPLDYRFIDVNTAFEKHTGLKNENLIGNTIRQVFPGIDKDEFDWIGIYGKIALNGGTQEIEQYSQPFNKWFRIHVFSTEKMFFTTFFYDITAEKLAEQNRQREKQTIENYLNTTETIMVSLDNSGIITMLNRHGLEILDYKPDEIIGKNWFETVLPQPEGMNVVFPVFQRIINGDLESVKEFENDVLTRTGERRTIAWRNSYQLDDTGNITGTLSSGLDITLRKQTEMELQNVRNLLEVTQQLAHVGGWSIDMKGNTLAWTDETFRIYELASDKPPDVLDAINYYHPDDKPMVTSIVQQAIEQGTNIDFEARLITAGNHERWVRAIGKTTTKDGSTIVLQGMVQDITERKLAEEAMRESEVRFSTFFQASPAAMAFTRLSDNRLIEVNAAWEVVTGFTRQETIGHTISELNIWVNPEQRSQMISEIGAKGKARQEVLVRQKSGEIRDLLMSAELIELSGETYLLSSAQDITERRNAEKALLKSEQHANALISAIPDMIFRMNAEGVFLDYKAAKEDLYLSPELFVRKHISEVMPGWFAQLVLEKIGNTISSGDIIVFEYALPIHEKGDTHFECRMVPYTENEVLAIVRNISERKEFERQIRESEANARAIMESTSDLFILLDKEGVVIDCNEAHASRLNMTRNDILGKNVFNYLPDEIVKTRKALVKKVMDTGQPAIGEDFRGGYWNEFVINPVFNAEGHVYRVAVFSRDITEKKRILGLLEEQNKTLQESEERFRKIFEDSPLGIALVRNDFRFIRANNVFCNLMGISSEELTILTFKDITHRDNIAGDMEGVRKLLSGESQVYKTEKKYVRKDGSNVWANANISVIRNQTGEFLYFLAIIEDITQRKMAEEALRISEDRLSKTMIAANDGIWDWNLRTGVVYFDPRYYTMAGYEVNEFPYNLQEFKNRVHHEDVENVMKDAENHIHGLTDRFQHEFRFRKKDGQYMWILGRGSIVERDKKGAPLRFVGTHQDISELKQIKIIDDCRLRLLLFAETHSMPELLEETLNETEKLTDSRIGFYHFIKDDQVTILLQNWSTQTKASYCKAEGHNSEYNLSQAGVWTDCIKERKPVIHNDYASLPHRKGMPQGHAEVIRELVVPVMRGKKIAAILGVGNKPTNYTQQDLEIVVKLADLAWDIAEKKLSAEALEKSELFLKELNATKDKFFSIIAHDLKSPFNSIVGFSDLLKEDARNLDVKDIEYYASIISSAANQTLQLLDNLLHWARMQQGRMDFEPRNLLLREITSEVINLLTEAAHQKNILMKNSIPEMVIINADENMIKTTIRNLVSNAIKFTRSGGSVEISARFTDREILVSVADTGIGISPENIGKLFNIGSSYTTRGTGNEKGTGLGLILCKEFIEKHGGRIWVKSEVSKGSTFCFTLPVRG